MSDLVSLRQRLDRLPVEPSQILAGLLVALVAVVAGVSWLVARPGAGGATGGAAPPAPPFEAGLPQAGRTGDGAADPSDASGRPPGDAPVVVHVSGAVARPGLIELAPPASGRRPRVADALDAAGGPLPDADLDRLNLAAVVSDGGRVHVPRRGEAVPPDLVGVASGGEGERGPPAVVDLNTATVDELDALPGIGPATAQAIVDYRTRRGRFRTAQQLLDVRGIGPAKLAELRERVRV